MSGSARSMSNRRSAGPSDRRRTRRRRTAWPPDARTLRAAVTGTLIGATAFVLLAGVTLLSFYLYFQASGRIMLGVRVGDVRLGNHSAEQATAALEAAWSTEGQGLTLVDGDRTWEASPAEFGLVLDAPATAQRALDVGHGQAFGQEMGVLADALLTGYSVPPAVALNEAAARAGLEQWAATVNQPPQDATLRIEGQQVVAVPGVPGRALDVEATLAALASDPAAMLRDGTLPLMMGPVAPRIADASGAVAEAEALLSAPLTVIAYDPVTDERTEWSAPPDVIATWLGVEATDDALHVTVDADRLAAYVAGLGEALGAGRHIDAAENAEALLTALRHQTPATFIVRHDPTTYTVQAGDTLTGIAWKVGVPFWRISEANPDINIDALVPGQQITIPSKDDLLPLPVVPGKRIVVSISQQRLWAYQDGQLLGEHVISTGIQDSPTQPGVFQVQSHELNAYASNWDLWMPHFLGIYEAWPGFMNGFHGLPTLSSGVTLWANILGRPASYGCIILDLDDAEWLYNWAEAGVVVEIKE